MARTQQWLVPVLHSALYATPVVLTYSCYTQDFCDKILAL